MLCPKCGQEYSGSSCPYCEKPTIIVNNQDYLARKMEYERKQAGVRSASSSDAKKADEQTGQESNELRPDEIFKKLADRVNGGESKEEDAKAKAKRKRRRARRIRIAVAAVLLLAVAVGATVAVLRFVHKNNQTLYTKYNGKIYNVSGIDSKYICDSDKAYFKADGSSFYVPDEPSDVSGKTVTDRLASDGGKYFTSVVYDDSSRLYTLYLWNDEANYRLSVNSSSKSVIYISDDGTVIYQETEMINEVGGIGGTSLYLSQIVKNDGGNVPTTTLLSDNVRQSCVYSDEQLVIYNTADDDLYSFYYGKNKTQTLIEQEVSVILTLSEDLKGYYSYTTSRLNSDKNISTVIFVLDGKAYMYDCLGKDAEPELIDSAAGGVSIYITASGGIYAAGSSTLRYAAYKNKELGDYGSLIALGSTMNMVYFPDRETIVAVTGKGELKSVNRGTVRDITDNVTEGTLSTVNNTDTGIVYVRNKILYYMNISSFDELIVSESAASASTADTLIFRNRLYYYDSAGKLSSCTVKGNDNRLIGDVERFWLGR